MKCDDARAAYLAGDADNAHIEHLGSCPACKAVSDDLDSTLAVLEGDAVWDEPGADLENRVVTLISGSSAETRRLPGRRYRFPAAAAAVVIASLITAGVLLAGSGGDPDWKVALPGTSNAPQASGSVQGWNEPSGTRLLFDIDGLPNAPADNIYEVWFSSGAVHISAGTFASGGEIEMWTGIARKDYPRIWITLEPIDVDESPSGHTVMDTG